MKTISQTWKTGKNALVLVLGIAVMYLGVTSLVDKRFNEIEKNTREQIAEQQTLLVAIAEATARNGADAVTESIVRDCSLPERSEFDNLLGRLDAGLSQAQLTELERLFGRCGTFYSERKSVMVSRLSREIEIYDSYVTQLGVIRGEDLSSEFALTDWKNLASEEKKQSELFARLVTLQDNIIATLLTGRSVQSTEIIEILQQVREVQQTLVVANAQASKVRARLIPL